jgi:chromosome segregation ATPase
MAEQTIGRITDLVAQRRAQEFAPTPVDTSEMRGRLDEALRTREAMRMSMAAEVKRSEALQEQIDQLKTELSKLQSELAQVTTKHASMATDAETHREAHQGAQRELSELKVHAATMGAKWTQANADLEAMRSSYQAELSARQEAEKRITAMAAEIKRPLMPASTPVIPPPPSYTLKVVSRDGNDRIREIAIQPVTLPENRK